ncbi:MAG: hypothetical protein JL50_05500 [Peptococcaceae bacterium BICA1-7]|nr:MAG: hypothetical protein JL50_05500 [Peptococcaceae bacterium BICA1-7]HBV96067.1 hypothetical protein [Desulfotomaculum sp.]
MPSWKDIKRFCENDGWKLYKESDHYFFRKMMPDGILKRTKVSRGSGQVKGHLWENILKKQLMVSKEYFNSKI